MKPNFALSLSFEGIRLLRRAYLGWHPVGEVGLDAPDLAAALADLRAKAQEFAPAGMTTKLVIPNDQIKFIDIPEAEDWATNKDGIVRAALENATPYDVADLVYDWSAEGGRVRIAAVARETLAEAESFAADHDFAPVSFVAIPEDGRFGGEPFFGETSVASQHMAKSDKVERDMAQIRVIPAPVPEPEPQPDPEPEAESEPDPQPGTTQDDTGPEIGLETDVEPVPTVAETSVGLDDATEDTEAQSATDTSSENGTTTAVSRADEDEGDVAAEPGADEGAAPALAAAAPATDAPVEDDTGAPAGFATIRAKRDGDVPRDTPRLDGVSRLSAAGLAGTADASADVAAPTAPPVFDLDDSQPDAPKGDATGTAPRTNGHLTNGADPNGMPADDVDGMFSLVPSPNAKPAKVNAPAIDIPEPDAQSEAPPLAAPAAATGAFASRRKKAPTDKAPRRSAKATRGKPGHPGAEDEKQRMTVFGARETQVGGKPRFLGLILTAVLLLFLVGVAAWASVFLDDGLARFFGGGKDTELAATPEITEDPIDEATGNLPSTDRVVTAALPEDGIIEPSALEDEPLPDLARFVSPDEALAQYAATGIWQLAPLPPDAPLSGRLDDLALSGAIPPVTRPDLSTLPTQVAALTDLPPTRPGQAETPAIQLDVEPELLVTATPDGALSPDGILIYAGRPEVEPPRDMARTEPEPDPESELQTEPQAEQAAPDAALAALRPRLRPDDLIEELPAEDLEEDEAFPEGDPALAGLRPRLRPEGLAPQTTTQPDPEDDAQADEADAAAIEAAVAAASTANIGTAATNQGLFENATAQAVTVSLTPNLRPRNFAAKVKAAREEQAATPVSTAQVQAPTAPTATSVARAATEKNVLKLRKVNLIGVYGGPSSRRALVRLGNGRYKKVKVGDRLDGGRVSAIGNSELRYTKRGQNLVLKMPKG